MSYEPREGIDYIVDLYAVAAVQRDAETADISKSINKQLSQYHPDRLQGVAPEFQARGEKMARILNKARNVLTKTENRQQYDAIISEWDGPVSTSGDPIMRIEDAIRADMSLKPADEVAAVFEKFDTNVDTLAKSSQIRADLFENMIQQYGGDVPVELREQYEATLLEIEQNLDVKETQRMELLGISTPIKYSGVTLGYADQVNLAIERAKGEQLEILQARALGHTANKLALLSGEPATNSTDVVSDTAISLPTYYRPLAVQVAEIAEKRQSILEKRLANFIPEYPERASQLDAKPSVLFGLGKSDDESTGYNWFAFAPDFERESIDSIDIPDEVANKLASLDYKGVFEAGFNVVVYKPLEHVDVKTLLNEAINKYIDMHYPVTEEEIS
jgi:curved DNA-binding protein CbpA